MTHVRDNSADNSEVSLFELFTVINDFVFVDSFFNRSMFTEKFAKQLLRKNGPMKSNI